MQGFSALIVPLIFGGIVLFGVLQGVKVFEVFLEGAAEGLAMLGKILPALVALLTAVGLFKVSGALDLIVFALAPAAEFLTVPKEVLPLALMRPISGSGAMAIYTQILTDFGPDSLIGRVASVLEGSSETTFYTIAVYYGAVGIGKLRHTIPAALSADFTAMILSTITVKLFLGG